MPFDKSKPQTLADVALTLESDPRLTDTQKRDYVSALSRVAEMTHRAPADIPADASSLREVFAGIHPAQHGIRRKTLQNVRANLKTALQVARALPLDEPRAEPTPAWQDFLDQVDAPHQAWSLSRLVNYCCQRGIEPQDVTNEVMTGFCAYLDARLLTGDPTELCKQMAQTWNRIVRRRELPLITLAYELGGAYRCRPLSDYPESLQAEIEAYCARLSHADTFDTEGPRQPLKPVSIRNIKAHLRQFLDALVEPGVDPDGLKTLADVATVENMKTAFRVIMDRHGTGAIPTGLHNIAGTLVAIARHHLKLDPGELDGMRAIKKRIAPNPTGMSPKNAQRLTPFNDPENIIRIVSLPVVLIEQAERAPSSSRSALMAMRAVAVAIQLSCPIRARNLAGLDLDRHLIAHRNGTHTLYIVRIEGAEVKNGESIEIRLNPRHSRILHRYITRFRPLLSDMPGTALFPRKGDGKPRTPDNFAQDLKRAIARETGLTVNVHLFRHIAAKLFLDANPGQFEVVRRLLRHRKLQTTIDFYAEISSQWAHARYDEAVLSKWGGDDD